MALRVTFFGRSQPHALSVLEAVGQRHQVVGIVESQWRTEPPAGRGRAWLDRLRGRPSLKAAAERRAIPYFSLTKGRSDELREFLRGIAPDVGAICSLAQLLPEDVIHCFPLGILNLHPSLLPKYRGPSPTFWEFWNREPEGGVTIHFIDSGEDTGDIVGQARVAIPFGTDGEEHFRRCHELGATLLVDALDRLSAGTIEPRPQRHLSCPFRARYVKPGEPIIDWAATPIEQVFHVLRGVLPLMDLLPPAPFPLRMLGFRASNFEHGTPLRPPGTYFIRRGRIAIAHGEGHVQLHAIVQPSRAARLARGWWQKARLRSGNR